MEFYDLKKENKFFDNENFINTLKFREKINLNNLNFSYQTDQKIIENGI